MILMRWGSGSSPFSLFLSITRTLDLVFNIYMIETDAKILFSFQDGHIDFYEFMTVLHVMSRGSSEDNLRQIFRLFDINRDGRISKEELERIVVDFQLASSSNIEQGYLVSSVFSEMDENEDGEISPDEFVEACLAKKKISTMLTLKIIDIFIVN